MQYSILPVNGSKVGDITFNTGPLTFVHFDKNGGTLNASEVSRIKAAFTRDGKYVPSVFLRAVQSGRLKITGDHQLEGQFKQAVPAVQKPKQSKSKSVEQISKDVEALQKQLAEALGELQSKTRAKKAE
jgi:hypothetical protein